jgi:hypothetical protein
LKHEIAKLSAGILYILSIAYIFGQAGLLEQDKISISQAIARLVPGLVVMGIVTVIINKIWKDRKEKAHTDPPIQCEHTTNNSIIFYHKFEGGQDEIKSNQTEAYHES